EFYTPSNLVSKMIEHSYNLGFKVLDPACGSGNFLIEIILKILDSELTIEQKVECINNVYGFDINPLAVLTAKVNLLLIYMDYFDVGEHLLPILNFYIVDGLFPEDYENQRYIRLNSLYNSFDLIIGNPPWLTYKDLPNGNYQERIKQLASELGIKPSSQYITHIEIAAIFFYAVPTTFLKKGGNIFFVITKSILNGDHCYKFRKFSIFTKLQIWDFPTNYFFNINHICLMAEYTGYNDIPIEENYPINARVYNDDLSNFKNTHYSSLKIEKEGTKLILPENKLKIINKVSISEYRDKFYQGATLVPRSLVFFQVQEKNKNTLIISSDEDVITRTKKRWKYTFDEIELEKNFRFKTFLNRDLIPFLLKDTRNIFLPINKEKFDFELSHLKKFPLAYKFYKDMNAYYQQKKKKTSKIDTLFKNLNYWNKLLKQKNNDGYLVIYNASGSNLKAAVINNFKKKIIVGSENYYFNTNSKQEAYYLVGVLNSPLLTKNIKLIKSSRHIHKRPFSFPIPSFNGANELHIAISAQGQKSESIVRDLYLKNPKINSDKVRLIINRKLNLLNQYVEEVVFTNT
ncbi:MAG: N-6 DNA methylase, partial [Candidatus Lokiarchaeota archaeon]|nr:N-6 DNA methylase [Candidatus Lokiarchaeota archaeon]MBD3339198.1 N-6 DNA methylase [Candidatus Lokiarchaeota archaeon]